MAESEPAQKRIFSYEEAAAMLPRAAWWALGAVGLSLCGAIAGGWLGAHHPNWETRPRLDDRASYKLSPEI